MTEQALGQFLSDEERIALNIERTRCIAEALCTHAAMLIKMGVPAEGIQPSVDQLRNHLSTQSRKEIKKIHKGLLEASGKMPTIALGDEVSQPSVATEVGGHLEAATTPELEPLLTEEAVYNDPSSDDLLPDVQESTEASVAEEGSVDSLSNEATEEEPVEESNEPVEEEPVIDERKPRRLSKSLNNAFGKSYTYGQRMVMSELNDEQQMQFVQLLQELAEAEGSNLIKRNAKLYAEMLNHLLKGRSVVEVGELVGAPGPSVSYAFRNVLPPFIHEHKRAFVEGYTEILAETPELLERAKEVRAQEEEQVVKREKIVHPEGVPDNIDNALIRVLDFEQRAAVSQFTDAQREALTLLIDRTLAKAESMQNDKDKWVGRFEQLLGGMAVRQVSNSEGLASPLGIIQGFSMKIPRILMDHKDEFVAEFETIRTGVTLNESKVEIKPELISDIHEDVAQAETEELPDQTPEIDEPITDTAVEDEPTVEIVLEQPVVVEPEQQEVEQAPKEAFVELMERVYATDDPIALRGISDLFSTERGIIRANEGTIEAARYLSGKIRNKNISLERSIANVTARTVIENMLGGIREGDSVRWVTFSQTLEQTPDVFRGNKKRAVESAFEKIAGMLGGEKSIPTDARELQVANLRSELYKYIGVSQEMTSQVIDRAIEKSSDYSSELGKALLFLNREAVGVGPDEMQLKIIRLFTTPQPGGAPLNVSEIRNMLTQEQVASRNGSSKQYDNGYVTSMLLRLFDKIVTQRQDG